MANSLKAAIGQEVQQITEILERRLESRMNKTQKNRCETMLVELECRWQEFSKNPKLGRDNWIDDILQLGRSEMQYLLDKGVTPQVSSVLDRLVEMMENTKKMEDLSNKKKRRRIN